MGAAVTTTIDFGATPVDEGTFNIVDASILATSYVEAFVMHNDTHVDNDAEAHKAFAICARLVCSANAGSFDLMVSMLAGYVTGNFKIRYVWS